MPYAAILFDLDGTLVDSITLYAEAVLEALAEVGLDTDIETFYDWYTRPLHLGQMLALHGLDEGLVPQVRVRRDALYEELLATRSEWLPGGRELLEDLRARKVPTAVVTGSWMSYVDAIDRKLGVKRLIDAFVTADDIHRFMKPHPHGLLLACERLRVEPKDCLYLGDQQFDTDAARAAEMPCWLIPGRWSPKAVTGAERTLKTPGEALAFLRS